MEIITSSAAETEAVGYKFAETLKNGDIIALRGGLGAGKTAFVRGMAAGLGIDGRITSPTFTIVNEYSSGKNIQRREFFHFDLYRLKNAEELFAIGWDDYISRNGICAVEWSENAPEAFDGGEITVEIEKLDENQRKITIYN